MSEIETQMGLSPPPATTNHFCRVMEEQLVPTWKQKSVGLQVHRLFMLVSSLEEKRDCQSQLEYVDTELDSSESLSGVEIAVFLL